MKVAKLILFVSNTILFLLGAAVVGVAGYVLGFNGDFSSVSPTFFTYMALGTGVVVMIISILACVATCNYTKRWAKVILMVYAFLLFIVMAIIIGAAAMVWMKRSELRGCESNTYGTADCRDDQHLLRNFANTTHVECCVGPDYSTPKGCEWVEDVISATNCQDTELWRRELWTYVNGKLKPVAIVVIIAAVVQAITILATCYLMMQHDERMVHPTNAMRALPPDHSGNLPTKSKTVLLVVNFMLLILGVAMVADRKSVV